MNPVSSEKGMMSLKAMLILTIAVLIIHVLLKLVPMYMDAERMKDEMATRARLAQTLRDEDILRDLVRKAAELDLPLGPENFVVQRKEENHRMTISTQWDVEVVFLFGAHQRTFHFAPVIDEDYTIRF